jgi:hypothetical protein
MDAGAAIPNPLSPGAQGAGQSSIARLQQHTGIAGTILLKLMTDPNVPRGCPGREAAESVIAHAIKGIEV